MYFHICRTHSNIKTNENSVSSISGSKLLTKTKLSINKINYQPTSEYNLNEVSDIKEKLSDSVYEKEDDSNDDEKNIENNSDNTSDNSSKAIHKRTAVNSDISKVKPGKFKKCKMVKERNLKMYFQQLVIISDY